MNLWLRRIEHVFASFTQVEKFDDNFTGDELELREQIESLLDSGELTLSDLPTAKAEAEAVFEVYQRIIEIIKKRTQISKLIEEAISSEPNNLNPSFDIAGEKINLRKMTLNKFDSLTTH